jgi:hypothetical protein
MAATPSGYAEPPLTNAGRPFSLEPLKQAIQTARDRRYPPSSRPVTLEVVVLGWARG